MKITFKNILSLLLVATACISFTSCGDNLSHVGESIRPAGDKLTPRVDSFMLTAQTVRIDSIYDRSVFSLLGQFNDPLYGDFRASYISRLQDAPGFQFKHKPYQGKIDSTYIRISYNSWVGDSTIWNKVSVYEITQPLPNSRYSTDLKPYLQGAKFLGSANYTAGSKDGSHVILVPIDNSIGERFYKASLEHPEYFDSRQAFEEHLMRGIYVESTTGNGCMLSVYNTGLLINYKYETTGKTHDGKADSTVLKDDIELFVNTQKLYMQRSFEENKLNTLVGSHKDFGYITSPGGLALSLTLKKELLQQQLIDQQEDANMQINSAHLELNVNRLDDKTSLLQPAAYVLLLPQDSLQNFFERGYTEASQPGSAFLSSIYSVTSRKYTFNNISLLLNKHIAENSTRDANGKLHLNKDLTLLAIPVSRSRISKKSEVTAALTNYIFPSAARIVLTDGAIQLKTVCTNYR